MSEQYCNQCKNQCASDALRCNRGRIHFGMEPIEPKAPAGPVELIERCGFIIHHGEMKKEEALSALTAQEQKELERLLSVLLTDWQRYMPEHIGKHHHGHH